MFFFLMGIAFLYSIKNFKIDGYSWFGIFLFSISLVFWVVSRIQLGKSFSVIPQAKQLVIRGIYGKIKHPMYLFSSLAFLGICIILRDKYWFLILFFILLLQKTRMASEDKILKEKFKEEYEKYNERVWF